MKRKSQIQSQVFVYVLAMIIIAVILLYGYKSISMMRQKGEDIDLLSFKQDVEEEVVKMSNDYGSANIVTFKTPSGFDRVCLVDLAKNPDAALKSEQPLVYESWADGTANVFLVKDLAEEFQLIQQDTRPLIEMEDPGYLCKDIQNNRIELRLEGTGGKALISETG